MTTKEISTIFPNGTKVKILQTSSKLYGEYGLVKNRSQDDLFIQTESGDSVWIIASLENLRPVKQKK